MSFQIQFRTGKGRLREKVVKMFTRSLGCCWLLNLMLFEPGANSLHDQFVHGLEMATADLFLHRALGLGLDLQRHNSNLAVFRYKAQVCFSYRKTVDRCSEHRTHSHGAGVCMVLSSRILALGRASRRFRS